MDLNVLMIDCQASGYGPPDGNLLEMGWLSTRAAINPPAPLDRPKVLCVQLPEGFSIPPAIQRLTGLSETDFKAATPSRIVWQKLAAAAQRTALKNRHEPCPAVIHYARYESHFISGLHRRFSRESLFPLQIFCTHEIAKRLFPDLPRLGLRALAGYFGHPVPEKRRCADHLEATAVIWHQLVKSLAAMGIESIGGLERWLRETSVRTRRGRVYPMAADRRKNVPKRPGVYRLLRSNGDVLYVGKATSLKTRVNSYFHKGRRHPEHILEMLTQAVDLDVSTTGSALEAALLETDEIKRLSPPYNIALKKNDRAPGFCTPDYSSHAGEPDPFHCIGPLPSANAMMPLWALGRVFASDTGADIPNRLDVHHCCAILDVPASGAPTWDDFVRGVEIFRYRHGEVLFRLPIHLSLLRLGTRLWRQRLAEQMASEHPASDAWDEGPDAVDGTLSESDNHFEWTPENVSNGIESAVRRCACFLRRARWYGLLSESTLSWVGKKGSGANPHQLTFRCGIPLPRHPDCPENDLFQSEKGEKSWSERRGSFNLATFDRMRVLTTELRRLVADDRDLLLRFGSGGGIGRKKLAGLFKWI